MSDLSENSKSKVGYLIGMNQDIFYKEYHAALQRAGVRDLPPYSCRHTTANHIKVYENGNISVHLKFADEFRRIAEYIEINTTDTAEAG